MHRKILFRNIFASIIFTILALFILFASSFFFTIGRISEGILFVLIALLFLFSSIEVYSNHKGAYAVMKIFFVVLVPVLTGGSVLFLGQEWVERYYSNSMNTPLIGTQEIVLILLLIFFISFIISLEKGQKRLSLPLDQLPANQKSATPPRKPALLTFIITVVIVVGYFLVGKRHQSVSEVPATYFERMWVNPNLPDEENGYLQLENLIGTSLNPLSKEQEVQYPLESLHSL
jgi:hypothetical protein